MDVDLEPTQTEETAVVGADNGTMTFDTGDFGEDEEITPSQLIERLFRFWQNEKLSPDLLPAQPDTVACVIDLLNGMQANVARASANDKKGDLKLTLHTLEIERIRFVLTDYLRIRLEKIERFAEYLLESERRSALNSGDPGSNKSENMLSKSEFLYARSYAESVRRHLDTLVSDLPESTRATETLSFGVPNTGRYVFVRAERDCDVRLFERADDEIDSTVPRDAGTLELRRGEQYLVPFRCIRKVLADNSVVLI